MRLRVLTLCAGIASHSRMPFIISAPAWATAAVLIFVFLLAVRLSAAHRRFRHPLKHGLCAALLFACGFLWAMLMAQMPLDQRLPAQLEGVDFWLIGRVEGLVRRDQADAAGARQSPGNRRTQQFDLRVESSCLRLLPEHCFNDPGFTDPGFSDPDSLGSSQVLSSRLVTLNDYAGLPVQSGQRWLLRVRVNRPHGFSNPGAYDFEAGQFQRGIMARGYVRETAFNTRLPPTGGVLSGLMSAINISRLRAALAADIEQIPALGNAGVLKALVVGDRDDISSAQWDLFTATGTNHLVVISGLHVGFVALCAWTLINRLSRRFPRLLLRVPAQHLAGYSAIMAAACYSLLAGFSLPTQRALIMITVLMASRISGRSVAPADSLAVAALLVLLMDPMAVTQAGFWLSFAAVASLFFAFVGYGQPLHQNRQSTIKTLWQRWVQPQWAVSVGLLLPLLLWTGQMSLNAPLANVFAIPLVSLLVVPLALVGAMMLSIDMTWTHAAAQFLLQQADRLLDWLQMFLVFISAWSPALWRPAVPSLLTMMLMALSSIVLLMPRGLAPRWLALPLLLPLIWPPPPARPPVGRVWLQFLDVGQGLAVVVHTRQHHLLFDTGPALGPDFDAGRAVILPYLYQSHVSYLDALIVSHWHADHSGGLNTVADNMAIGRRLAGPAQSSAANWYDDYRFEGCEAGQHWQWDDVHFTVLFPPADPSLAADGNVNNSSCVLLIEAGGQGVLLTGDIEEAAERRLLATHADLLDVDVLQAPHHGSRSSSSAAFVQATSPTWVVMSAGYRNRFDHPHSDIVERYQRHGAQVLFSADSGAVLMEIGGDKPVLLSRHRQQHRRFWFNL